MIFRTAFVEPKGSLAYNQSIESTLRPDVCLLSDAGYTIKMVGVSFRVPRLFPPSEEHATRGVVQ
jgi:hypothetical protein